MNAGQIRGSGAEGQAVVRCPTELDLERFVSADCNADDAERIARHVTDCTPCREWVGEARADEDLLGELRGRTTPDPRGGRPRLERYRVTHRIGHGAMGVVWEAEQASPRRRVAIKVLAGGTLSPSRRARFALECELLGHLDHPGVARIHEAGTCATDDGERPYIAMELVDGRPLLRYADEERLDRRARLELFASVCDAVQHAHQKGVVHRDLKSSNVLVTDDGCAKVLDFGVARRLEAGTGTLEGQIVGTLATMAPEQVRGAEVDTRADVYALGVLLYELLSGVRPIDVEGLPLTEAARRIEEALPAPLGRRDPTLAGDLEAIAARALEKEPERRYASAEALSLDVRRHLRSEPVSARPPSALYQLGRFARRNRRLSASLGALAVALVVGVVASSALLVRSRRAERRALDERAAAVAEATRMAAVRDLLFEVLLVADRRQRTTDREPTLREAIELADLRIDQHAPDDPLAEALFRHAIGMVWTGTKDYDRAEAQLARALELLERHGGDSMQADVRYVVQSRAKLAFGRGDHERAAALAREALSGVNGTPNPAGRATLANVLGLALMELGRPDEARPWLEESLELWIGVQGQAGEDVGISWKNLGIVRARTGDPEGAGEALDRALEILPTSLGETHPLVTQTLLNHAQWCEVQGRVEQAGRELERAVSSCAGRVETDPLAGKALLRWGALLLRTDRPQRAAAELERALDNLARTLGPEHALTREAETLLGRALDRSEVQAADSE